MPHEFVITGIQTEESVTNGGDQGAKGRKRGIASAVAIFLGAAVVGTFGIGDLFGDTDYAVRLRAGIMTLVAAFMILGAGTILRYAIKKEAFGSKPAAGAIALSSSAVATAVGLALALYQIAAGDSTPWLLAWAAIFLAGISISIHLFRRSARIPYPKQFALAATAATLIAIANFGYTTFYEPSANPVQISVQVSMGKPSYPPGNRFASIPIAISFKNTGKTGLELVMSTYSIVGPRAHYLTHDKTREQMNLDLQGSNAASQRIGVDRYDVIQSDRFIFEGTEFEPGDEAVANRTVEVAVPTPYDSLALNAWVLVLRADDVKIVHDISQIKDQSWNPITGEHEKDARDWAAASRIDWARREAPIGETSFLRTQTRRSWVGYVWTVASDPAPGRPPGSYLSFHFTSDRDPDSDKPTADADNAIAAERYGLTRSNTGLLEKSAYELGIPTQQSS